MGTLSRGIKKQKGCGCTKEDFLPDSSFQSWSSYLNALKDVPNRFVDRLISRSEDQIELHELKSHSQFEMAKTLTGWDLMCFCVGAIMGAGIFVLTGVEAKLRAGPAVVLSYLIAGFSSLLSVLCYTEFAVEIPVAGGSFAYLRIELGDFVAFLAAGNILLEYVLGGAAVARAWTSYFATLCDHDPDSFRMTAPTLGSNYNLLDPIAVVVIAVVCVLAVTSTKITSRLNFVTTTIHMVVILFIIFAGLSRAEIHNYEPFAPHGLTGIFHASAVLFFAFVGFDAVSTMAEETKNPIKDIPFGLIGSMIVAIILYCLLAITLCLMVRFSQIDINAPFSKAFVSARMGWAKYIVDIGALKGMTTVLLVNAIGQARYLTHIARAHMLPPWFAQISSTLGTPANATVFMLIITAAVALFTDVTILSNLLSIATLLTFMLVALALLVRRYYSAPVTTRANRVKLIICITIILASSIAAAICWSIIHDSSWIAYVVTTSVWFLSTLGIRLLVPQARVPKFWGVPFMPWVPSASIFINMFLLASIDRDSYIRFGIWTAILMIYYLLFGLHASYDIAKSMDQNSVIQNV